MSLSRKKAAIESVAATLAAIDSGSLSAFFLFKYFLLGVAASACFILAPIIACIQAGLSVRSALLDKRKQHLVAKAGLDILAAAAAIAAAVIFFVTPLAAVASIIFVTSILAKVGFNAISAIYNRGKSSGAIEATDKERFKDRSNEHAKQSVTLILLGACLVATLLLTTPPVALIVAASVTCLVTAYAVKLAAQKVWGWFKQRNDGKQAVANQKPVTDQVPVVRGLWGTINALVFGRKPTHHVSNQAVAATKLPGRLQRANSCPAKISSTYIVADTLNNIPPSRNNIPPSSEPIKIPSNRTPQKRASPVNSQNYLCSSHSEHSSAQSTPNMLRINHYIPQVSTTCADSTPAPIRPAQQPTSITSSPDSFYSAKSTFASTPQDDIFHFEEPQSQQAIEVR